LSQSSWLVGGVVPGIERQPCKKLEPSPELLLAVLHRWRDEAIRAGRTITRIAELATPGRIATGTPVPEAASLKAAAREECVRSKPSADFCHNNAAALLTADAHR
jgi:hypothetical protein